MDNPALEKFFYYFSKFIIVFPIFAIAVLLLIAKNPFDHKESKISPTPIELENIDFKGSYICTLNPEKNATISAYIKDDSARATIAEKGKTSQALLSDDCLYSWQQGKTSGEKMCGISQYMELLKVFNLANPQFIFETFMDEQYPNASGGATQFHEVCKKQEIKDNKVFAIPKNIKFKEQRVKGK